MPRFTARNVTKVVAKTIVSIQVASMAEDAITDHTRFDDDDMIVVIGTKLLGWYVSDRLQPYTDKIVDTTFDFVAEQRAQRRDRKNNEK